MAIEAKSKADQEKMDQGLYKFHGRPVVSGATTDSETGQTLISGMGELHLEIIVDRLPAGIRRSGAGRENPWSPTAKP